jgi:predicted RNase H-like nuclease
MTHPKGKPEGYRERRRLLTDAIGVTFPDRPDAFKLTRPAKPDDVLDAIVAAWTAKRAAEGRAERLPPDPPIDQRGLRMEIVH